MQAEASVSTGDDDLDGDEDSEPELHDKDEHRAEPHENEGYVSGYLDVLSDFVSRFRLYLFVLALVGVVGLWYFGAPRWAYFAGFSALGSIAVSWGHVFRYVSRLDDGLDTVMLEVNPDDDAETHAYEVGDGALDRLEVDGYLYPHRGVTDVYEVERLDDLALEADGSPRAALPYSEYIDLEYARQYHRDNVVPLASKVPLLEAEKRAETNAEGLKKGVRAAEILNDGLNGDLGDGRLDDSTDDSLEDLDDHAPEPNRETEVSSDD